MKINFHVHTTGSDGVLSPEEVVKQAINVGISHLCFTDHYKRPGETVDKKYFDQHYYNENYKKEIRNLAEKYEKDIKIYFGAEIDWLEGYEDWIKETIKENEFDFIIGSIHVMKINNNWLSFDNPREWENSVKEIGSIKELIQEYYKQLRLLVKSQLFDCVGHLDYIKIGNKNLELFSEKEDWYKKEVLETLKEIKKVGMCLEINIRGFRKPVNEQYPSERILKEAFKMGILITIGTDFHGKKDEKISDNLEKAYELAKRAGYKSVLIFKNRKAEEIEI